MFFHEVFGHRDEGFRQKDSNEGQTLARKVGESIMPSFITIVDDPTKARLNKSCSRSLPLMTTKACLHSEFFWWTRACSRNFEMSRQTLKEFPRASRTGTGGDSPARRRSHGRATPVAIVESSNKVSNAELRRLFMKKSRSRESLAS